MSLQHILYGTGSDTQNQCKTQETRKKFLNSGLGDGGYLSKKLTNKVKVIMEHHSFPKLLHSSLVPWKVGKVVGTSLHWFILYSGKFSQVQNFANSGRFGNNYIFEFSNFTTDHQFVTCTCAYGRTRARTRTTMRVCAPPFSNVRRTNERSS